MRFVSPLLIICCLVVLFHGCARITPQPGSRQPASPAYQYLSQIDDPRAKAYYFFSLAIMRHNQGDLEGVVKALENTMKHDTRTPGIRLYLAEVLLQLSREEEAIHHLEDVLIENPRSTQAYRLLGEVLFEKGLVNRAEEAFRKLVELLPDKEDPVLLLVQVQARKNNHVDAIETLKVFLSEHDGSYRAHYALARLYRQIGLNSSAVQSYRRVLALQPKLLPVYQELGRLYENSDDEKGVSRAIGLYREGLQHRKDDPGIRHRLVRLLLISDQYELAQQHLEILLANNPDDTEALRKYGLLKMEYEDWPEAARTFERLLQLTDERDPVRYYLGNVYEKSAQPYEALREFLQISVESDLYPDARVHAAYLYRMLGETRDAYQVLMPLLDDPRITVDYYLLTTSLASEAGYNNDALQIFQRGEELFPGNTKVVYQHGTLLEKMGMRDASRRAMQKVLELDPYHSEALNFIAYQYAEEGTNLEHALKLARRAVELNEAGHIYDTLGWVLFRLDRHREALKALKTAVQKLPDDPTIREHIGDVYVALGQYEQSLKHYRKALELDPDNTSVRKKIEDQP